MKEQLGHSESAVEQSLVYMVEKKAQDTECAKYEMEGFLVGVRVGFQVGARNGFREGVRVGCRDGARVSSRGVGRVGARVGCLVGAVNARPTQEFKRIRSSTHG